MKFLRTLGAVVVAAVLATACSASSDTSADGPLPFDAVLIELFGTDDTDAYVDSIEAEAAALVTECMAAAGFEFAVAPPDSELAPPDPTDLAAAQTRGFGIIDNYRQQIRGIDVTGASSQDPNLPYLATLSAAEIDRFFFTLEGPEPEPGQRPEGGCNNESTTVAYADWVRFSAALPNFTALGEERDTHPDWLAARSDWRACMTERGFDYSEPDAIRTDVIERMRDSVAEVYPSGQVPLVIVDGVAELDPAVDELLDELVEFEVDAAVANVECTEPLASRFDAVERLVQQQFVDRNRATIDSLLQAN